jgi:hypothetical protein
MSVAPLLVRAAEAEASSGVSPWLVGGGTLLLLLLVMGGLLAFGGGRDHS